MSTRLSTISTTVRDYLKLPLVRMTFLLGGPVAPEAMAGMISLSVGLLDSTEGLRLAADISHDEKPGFYAFEGERRVINSSELEGMFSGRGR